MKYMLLIHSAREAPDAPHAGWPHGGVWTRGDVQFRAERLTRRDAIPANSAWHAVLEVMAVLARLHGAEHCRLVVWFNR